MIKALKTLKSKAKEIFFKNVVMREGKD